MSLSIVMHCPEYNHLRRLYEKGPCAIGFMSYRFRVRTFWEHWPIQLQRLSRKLLMTGMLPRKS